MTDRSEAITALTAESVRRLTTTSLYRKTALTEISDTTFPPGTPFQTPEGLRAEDEDTRAAFDVQGGVYPIRESVFRASYEPAAASSASSIDVERLARAMWQVMPLTPEYHSLGSWRESDRTDAAWARAEAALPEGWRIEGLTLVDTSDSEDLRDEALEWEAEASKGGFPSLTGLSGYGNAPAAALIALAEKLEAATPGPWTSANPPDGPGESMFYGADGFAVGNTLMFSNEDYIKRCRRKGREPIPSLIVRRPDEKAVHLDRALAVHRAVLAVVVQMSGAAKAGSVIVGLVLGIDLVGTDPEAAGILRAALGKMQDEAGFGRGDMDVDVRSLTTAVRSVPSESQRQVMPLTPEYHSLGSWREAAQMVAAEYDRLDSE